MKKILSFGLVIAIFMSIFVVSSAKSNMTEPKDALSESSAVSSVLKNIEGIESTVIGEVAGEPVYDDEFMVRYAKAVASKSLDPYNETVDAITRLKEELAFVKDKNIEVTQEEVIKYTNQQRDWYEKKVDPELRAGIKNIISSLGLSEDEYWSEYKILENTKYLNHINTIEYLEQHDMTSIPLNNSDFRVIDNDYRQDKFDMVL